MGLSNVRPYFRTRMNSLGYSEFKDGFASDAIPNTILNKAYHIDNQEPAIVVEKGVHTVDISMPVKVRIYFKGGREASTAIDNSWTQAQTILCDLIKPSNANTANIKTINLVSISSLPLSDSNNNDVILEMDFEAKVLLDYR